MERRVAAYWQQSDALDYAAALIGVGDFRLTAADEGEQELQAFQFAAAWRSARPRSSYLRRWNT
jgi:hypothetical protein